MERSLSASLDAGVPAWSGTWLAAPEIGTPEVGALSQLSDGGGVQFSRADAELE